MHFEKTSILCVHIYVTIVIKESTDIDVVPSHVFYII